jgi:Rne/Rng family ribonuclease
LLGFSSAPQRAGIRVGDVHVARLRTVDRSRGLGFVDLAGEVPAMLDLPRFGPLLKEGELLLVQVRREARGSKLAKVSGRIDLAGRGASITMAGPIGQSRLKRSTASDERARIELGELGGIASEIERISAAVDRPTLIRPGRDAVADLLFRFPESSAAVIHCDTRVAAESVRQLLERDPVGPDSVVDHDPVRDWPFSQDDIGEMLDDALEREQILATGGAILVEPCETLTAIDVNAGGAASASGGERVLIAANLAACAAIARSVRLLNLSGNIVIDFIGVRAKARERELVDRLRAAFAADPAQPWIGGMSPIGLVEMSRRYLGASLYDRFPKKQA